MHNAAAHVSWGQQQPQGQHKHMFHGAAAAVAHAPHHRARLQQPSSHITHHTSVPIPASSQPPLLSPQPACAPLLPPQPHSLPLTSAPSASAGERSKRPPTPTPSPTAPHPLPLTSAPAASASVCSSCSARGASWGPPATPSIWWRRGTCKERGGGGLETGRQASLTA